MRSFLVELKPSYQIEPDERGHGWWKATNVDPQFILNSNGAPLALPLGHYILEIDNDDDLVGLVNPCLYVDFGRGLNGNDKVSLLFHRVKDNTYRCYFNLFSDVRLVRFDPSERRVHFHIGAIRLRQLTRIEWYVSSAKLITKARRGSGSSIKALVTTAVARYRAEGLKGVAARVRAAISRPLAETVANKEISTKAARLTVFGEGTDKPYADLYFNQSMVTEGYKHPSFAAGRAHTTDARKCDVKLIAYYLPQFHPFAENDEWWGKGFTEWTNVTKALPRFVGHYQPKLPTDLGFYDLRNVDVMREQAALATKFGITGFCFHFYWFDGKRLMETPILNFRAAEDINFEYSLCWANENWSRRWDGAEHELLIGQRHSPDDDLAFINYVSRYFSDKRYIKIDGKPVLTVYRPDILPDPKATAERWRKAAKELGFPDLFLVATTAFGFTDYEKIGFDALSEFPPHAIYALEMVEEVKFHDPRFAGAVLNYQTLVTMQMDRDYPTGVVFPGVMPAWDNVARRPLAGNVFHNSTPEAYRTWLRYCADRARQNEPGKRLIFINAWNEWAEGAYLEPDRMYGHAYLWATASVIDELSDIRNDASELLSLHNARFVPRGGLAVAAHLFYPDAIEDLAGALLSGNDIDVYVTVPKTVNKESVDMLIALFPRSYILAVDNCGRDILPFIKLLPKIKKHPYQWVCKVHGKKSVHLGQGKMWREQLFASLLGGLRKKGSDLVHPKLPNDNSVGLVGPGSSLMSLDDEWGMQSNIGTMNVLLEKLKVSADIKKGSFVAGSMFWFRPASLDRLVMCNLNDSDFGVELGRIDGTPAHAMERLFGIIASKAGYTVTEFKDSKITAAIQLVKRAK